MSADGHGLPDNAVIGVHDIIHHAEQEEHEHEAAAKRGLPDSAIEAEHEFMQHAEDDLARMEVDMFHTMGLESGSYAVKVVTTAPPALTLSGREKPLRRDVSTFINYYRDPGDGSPPMPVRISDKTVKNERPHIAKPAIIRDVTGEEANYTLDEHGFHFCRRESSLRGGDFHDSELVQAKYYPEAEQLLKDMY
ncbi:hypothetical protein NPX13_g8939 [Xylaria arbuscula]|uniref:Uncharacterized protein n=1 Tax=Xylaria arbuscula TaxID=114810 RepID=A0A9W8N7G2_9PEZI|nr:hypothetical protein NPX13_g8939 [Xylaria arbuscula]